MRNLIWIAVMLSTIGGTASAQWIDIYPPGTPRTQDGKVNLSAPAPRTPDGKPSLAGVWRNIDIKYLQNLAADGIEVPMTPWAATVYKQRQETNSKGRPSERCLPHGI